MGFIRTVEKEGELMSERSVLENEISFLRNQVNTYSDEITRLKKCKQKFSDLVGELEGAKQTYLQPELSKPYWSGQTAHNFEEKRQTKVVDKIDSTCIAQVESMIQSVDSAIQAKQGAVDLNEMLLSSKLSVLRTLD